LIFHHSTIADEVKNMAVSYKKLWKLLIDKDMKKKKSPSCGRYKSWRYF